MANRSVATAINYFAVFQVNKVDLVDTTQKLSEEKCYIASFAQKITSLSHCFSG